MVLPVKLFLVPIDGPQPWEWTPFGGVKLSQLAARFSDSGKHPICAIDIKVEITSAPFVDLSDEVVSRVVGCILDLNDYVSPKKIVPETLRVFANRMKEKNKIVKTTKLFILVNVGSCVKDDVSDFVVSIKEKLSLQGFTSNDIVVYTMRSDEDVGNALSFMTTNIVTNEFICLELSGS